MELVLESGCVPRFPFDQFCVCEKKYEQQEEKTCWKDRAALREFCTSMEENPATIVGHIDAETAEKWLDWNLGELFVVACRGDFVFCTTGGLVVAI